MQIVSSERFTVRGPRTSETHHVVIPADKVFWRQRTLTSSSPLSLSLSRPPLSLSLSHTRSHTRSHTHTHIHTQYIYIVCRDLRAFFELQQLCISTHTHRQTPPHHSQRRA